MYRNRLIVTFCTLLLLASAALPGVAFAASTLSVTTGGLDSGNCISSACHTIAYAISQASAGDTISLAAGTYTEAGIGVDRNLTITGAGASSTIVQANALPNMASSSVFIISSGVTASLAGLTIRHGNTITGGGIDNSSGGNLTVSNSTLSDNYGFVGGAIDSDTASAVLTLNNVTVSGNTSYYGGGLYTNGGTATLNNTTVSGNTGPATDVGGGIYNTATLTLNNSTVSGNTSDGYGGGIANVSSGNLTLNNSTVSGDTASGDGGGIYDGSGSIVVVNYSTIVGNTSTSGATGGGGIAHTSATVTIKSSIIAGNKYGTDGTTGISDCAGSGTLTSQDYNLTGSGTGCTLSGTHNVSVAPANIFTTVLGPLANNGGPTQTHALLAGSPALNQIPNAINGCGSAPFDFDQRGQARPFNSTCDIGAFEAGDTTPPTVSSIARAGADPTTAASLAFTVTFSEPVTGVDIGDFTLVASGIIGASIANVTGSGTARTVTINTGTGSGTIRLDLTDNDSITDLAFVPNLLGGAGAGNGNHTGDQFYTLDRIAPLVSSINRAGSDPSAAATVDFTVTFSKAVSGVDASDFTVAASGVTGTSVMNVTGSGATRTVTVNTGAGSGTIRLDLIDDDTIIDALSNPLGGAGANNGNHTGDQFYTLDRTGPLVSSIIRTGADPSAAASVDFTVTFSEAVTGVDNGDFTLTTTGVTGASITGVTGAGATRTVTVNTGTGSGTIRLDLIDDDTILDALSNPLGGAGMNNDNHTGDQFYTMSRPQTFSLVFRSVGSQDGWILETSEFSGRGGAINSAASTFLLGDDAANRQYRSILSFNTTALPENATIQSVILKIKQSGAPIGVNPFNVLGSLLADIHLGPFGAAALQATDFKAAASATKVATFNKTPAAGWYSATFTPAGFGMINLIGLTQLRLYFAKDDNNNHKADFMKFLSGNTPLAANRPQLIIVYSIP